jgi:exosortase
MQLETETTTWPSIGSQAGLPRELLRRHWRQLLLILLVIFLYGSVLRGLVGQWYHDADYSHGFFVPIFGAFLIWLRRDVLRVIPRKPDSSGLLVVLGAQGLLFLGSLGAELFLTRVSLIFTICGLVIYFLGWAMLRSIAFPLGFLFLMVPLPTLIYNEIVFPLQLLASRFATYCLASIRVIPVVREGNLLILPNYTLEVVEACSGIRSLMSLIALALAYGYLAEKKITIRAFLVALMVPVAVMSNGFRVMVTAILTSIWGSKVGDGFLHSFSGCVLFLSAATCLFLTHSLLSKGSRWLRRIAA